LVLLLLVVTDILTNDSVCIAIGKATQVVEKEYNVTLENNTATLKGVVSRKKQIVPVLTETFQTL
ncbi:manganese-dependent inorganic pyrophosphatase, partial [Bacillus pseudomycoides]|uniref:DHHA2 domain-containing protein n=1 Tax=Bacillus pseudomycoides TaxID=64104 RepID=UPI002E1F35AE|nr:manganese-dependent inorganic pyrophosphatase [Bacillus pseudomycoides]